MQTRQIHVEHQDRHDREQDRDAGENDGGRRRFQAQVPEHIEQRDRPERDDQRRKVHQRHEDDLADLGILEHRHEPKHCRAGRNQRRHQPRNAQAPIARMRHKLVEAGIQQPTNAQQGRERHEDRQQPSSDEGYISPLPHEPAIQHQCQDREPD